MIRITNSFKCSIIVSAEPTGDYVYIKSGETVEVTGVNAVKGGADLDFTFLEGFEEMGICFYTEGEERLGITYIKPPTDAKRS